jgi:hypothetical protein
LPPIEVVVAVKAPQDVGGNVAVQLIVAAAASGIDRRSSSQYQPLDIGRDRIGDRRADLVGVALAGVLDHHVAGILYSPKAGLFDGTWKLPDIELVK